jgi:outer membrane protein
MYRNSILFLGWLLSAHAMTLDEAVSLASLHNRQIQISGLKVAQRREELAAEQTHRLPVASVTGSFGISLTPAAVTFPQGAFGIYPGIGPIPGSDVSIGIPRQLSGFSYSQVAFPLTQQIRLSAALAGARADLRLAENARVRSQQEVVAQVRQLYFAILAADAAQRAAQADLTLAHEVEQLARRGLDAGTALPADEMEAAAHTAHVETLVARAAAEGQNLREQFNILLGRALDERVELDEPRFDIAGAGLEAARATAAANRPEVQEARLEVRRADAAVRAKKTELIPDVSLAVQHFGFLNTGNLAPANYAVAGISVTWEPWDWGRRSKETHALQNQVDAARAALDETTVTVMQQAGQAVRAWEQSRRELAAAEAAMAAARESLDVTRQRYEQRAALLRQLLEAQSAFESAQEQHLQALAARGAAWARLQLALGSQ